MYILSNIVVGEIERGGGGEQKLTPLLNSKWRIYEVKYINNICDFWSSLYPIFRQRFCSLLKQNQSFSRLSLSWLNPISRIYRANCFQLWPGTHFIPTICEPHTYCIPQSTFARSSFLTYKQPLASPPRCCMSWDQSHTRVCIHSNTSVYKHS